MFEDNNNQQQQQQRSTSFESLDTLIFRWRNGTFSEILDDWRWIFTYSKRYKKAIAFYIILGILSTTLGLVSSIAGKYIIDIITGYSIGEDRPNYSALLEEVDKGNIGIILFSELTRLGRNSTELLAEVQRLQDKGVELYFEKQDLWVKNDKKDLGSRILLAVLAITTSYEIELFAERSISGKINKITKGGGVGGDNNAYGYMNDENKMMVIREDEAEIIRRIFNMYADGKSTIEICDILNTEGIPTSYGTRLAEFKENRQRKGIEPKEYKHFKNGEDFKWRPSSIAKLLAKDLYKGHRFVQFRKPQVDKLEKKNGEPVEPEIAFTYDVQLEKLRIVDDELFQRVQDRLAQAAYNKNNAIKHENLLKAKLICGECGSRFSVGKQSDTAIKYKVNPRTYKCYGCALNNLIDCPNIVDSRNGHAQISCAENDIIRVRVE